MDISELSLVDSFEAAHQSIVKASSWNEEEIERINTLLEGTREERSSLFTGVQVVDKMIETRDRISSYLNECRSNYSSPGYCANYAMVILFFVEMLTLFFLPSCRRIGDDNECEPFDYSPVYMHGGIDCHFVDNADVVTPFILQVVLSPCTKTYIYNNNCTGDFWVPYFDKMLALAQEDYHISKLPAFIYSFVSCGTVICLLVRLISEYSKLLLTRKTKEVCRELVVVNNPILHKYVEFKRLSLELHDSVAVIDSIFLTLLKDNAPECQYLLTLSLTKVIDHLQCRMKKISTQNGSSFHMYQELQSMNSVLQLYNNTKRQTNYLDRLFDLLIEHNFFKDFISFLSLCTVRIFLSQSICDFGLMNIVAYCFVTLGFVRIGSNYTPSRIDPYLSKDYSYFGDIYQKLENYSKDEQHLLISKFLLETCYTRKNIVSDISSPLLLKVAKELHMKKQVLDQLKVCFE